MTADEIFAKKGLVKGVHEDEGIIFYQGNSFRLIFDIRRGVDYFEGIYSWSEALDKEDWLKRGIRKKREELWG